MKLNLQTFAGDYFIMTSLKRYYKVCKMLFKINLSEFMYNDYEIFGCAYDCPLQKRTQDCPFMEIEHLTFKEKVDWIEDLNKGKKELIIKHHWICSRDREQKKKQAVSK